METYGTLEDNLAAEAQEKLMTPTLNIKVNPLQTTNKENPALKRTQTLIQESTQHVKVVKITQSFSHRVRAEVLLFFFALRSFNCLQMN